MKTAQYIVSLDVTETGERLARVVEQLEAFRQIAVLVGSETSIEAVLGLICDKTTQLMRAERTTIFLVEKEPVDGIRYINSIIAEKSEVIRLKFGQGIAGTVAEYRKPLNIRDAYECPLFDPSFDRMNGFKTRTCLCMPVLNIQRELLGVVQVINKISGYFGHDDEESLTSICSQIGVCLTQHEFYRSLAARNAELSSAREQLRRQNAELERLYRMEREAAARSDLEADGRRRRLLELGEMMSSLMHDMKTPLANIAGYVDLMASQQDASRRSEFADIVSRQVESIRRMSAEVLGFARGSASDEMRPIKLGSVASKAAGMLAADASSHGVEIAVSDTYGGTVMGDGLQLQRLVINLIKNAIEAVSQQNNANDTKDTNDKNKKVASQQMTSVLADKATTQAIRGHIKVSISKSEAGEGIALEVSDDGPGIPADIAGHIFDPFVTSCKEGGTGLGLSIVTKIAAEHHASVSYRPNYPHGAIFGVTFAES